VRGVGGTAVANSTNVAVTFFARCAAAFLLCSGVVAATAPDPFAWLHPVVTMDAVSRARLDRGEVIVRILPAVDGELAVFAAARLNADSEMLGTWAASIAQLKKSPYVLTVQRFSDPPAFEDLQSMALDDDDLEDVRRCRSGDCNLKLSAQEMALLRLSADGGGPHWKDAVQYQFRRAVLNRVATYEAGGFAGLPPYVDRRRPVLPSAVFGVLLDRSPYLESAAFNDADVDSFFYWSKEQYGAGKSVISVTHVDVVRPREAATLRIAVVGREIFATHYRNASIGVTAVTEDTSGQRYLMYVNRSHLDVLGGIFGGWKRAILEGRVKNESAAVFNEVRRRLESGPPPD
jgi:hypothetical protein